MEGEVIMAEKKDSWLRQYTLTLVAGVCIILLVGIISNADNTPSGITGFVIADGMQSDVVTGRTTSLYVISKDCALSPAELYASAGDRIRLKATVYDPTGRTHRITIPNIGDEGVSIRVQGNEVNYAEFYAPKGEYYIIDAYPCEAQGIRARAKLIVR